MRRRLLATGVALALVAAACGDDGDPVVVPEEPPETVTPTTGTAAVPAPPSTTDDPVSLADVDLALTQVAELVTPTAMAVHPDADTLFFAQRAGTVVAVTPGDQGGPGTVSEPIVDISDDVSTQQERGLLGLTFSPDGERLYLSFTDLDGASTIDEFAVSANGLAGADGFAVDQASRRTVLTVDQPFSNHNGGGVDFGPDGLLYVGLGDGGGADDPEENGQDRDTLLGSILRIDPQATGDGEGYEVPADNPFTDGRPEIWLYGARNPWRFSFDRATGDLWVADVGQNEIEEINWLPAVGGVDAGRAANLGWNLREGTREFTGPEPPDHVPPVFEYDHSDGNCSVTGGYVYRGSAIPGLTGAYVFGDFCVSAIRGLRVVDGEAVDEVAFGPAVDPQDLVSFGEDADGELYVLTLTGRVLRIDPA